MAVSVEHLRLPRGDNLDILLIGMSGDGKSSTGNSILNRQRFRAMGGPQSVTRNETYDDIDARIDGRVLTVVDTPGFSDTRAMTDSEREDMVAEAITHSLAQCPLGFDAIVLVLSYCRRLDDRVRDILKYWMYMIGGDEAFQTHGVIALTYGDAFLGEKEESMTLQKWWEGQCISDKWFWDQCSQRCVLFQNKTNNFVVRRQQLYDLVTAIDGMGDRDRIIPSLCWLRGIEGALVRTARDECWNIRNIDKYFSLLRQSLEHLTSEIEGDKRYELLEQLERDLLRLRFDLTQPENNFIHTSIEEQFSQLMEKLEELKTLEETHEPVLRSMIAIIVEVHVAFYKLLKNTEYWRYVKREVKNAVPGLLGALGFAAVTPAFGPSYGAMAGAYLYDGAERIKRWFDS